MDDPDVSLPEHGGKSLEVRGPTQVVPQQASQATALIHLIERAARDPSVDMAKMERLFELHKEVEQREAKRAYYAALSRMQKEMPVVDKKGTITIREKTGARKVIQSTPYALWDDINALITPILSSHGFTLSFRTTTDEKIKVTGIVAHDGGHLEETTITLQHDSTGSKNAVQAVGSSISYGKRYTASLLLNIQTKGEDDDGKGGSEDDVPISDDQVAEIVKLLEETDSNDEVFCNHMGVTAVKDIATVQFEYAIGILKRKKEQMTKPKGQPS